MRGYRHGSFVDFLGIHVNLHPPTHVRDIKKTAFTHVSVGSDSSRQANNATFSKPIPDFGDGTRGVKSPPERIDTKIPDGLKFLTTDGDKVTKRRRS